MYCYNCGTALVSDARFCAGCGIEVSPSLHETIAPTPRDVASYYEARRIGALLHPLLPLFRFIFFPFRPPLKLLRLIWKWIRLLFKSEAKGFVRLVDLSLRAIVLLFAIWVTSDLAVIAFVQYLDTVSDNKGHTFVINVGGPPFMRPQLVPSIPRDMRDGLSRIMTETLHPIAPPCNPSDRNLNHNIYNYRCSTIAWNRSTHVIWFYGFVAKDIRSQYMNHSYYGSLARLVPYIIRPMDSQMPAGIQVYQAAQNVAAKYGWDYIMNVYDNKSDAAAPTSSEDVFSVFGPVSDVDKAAASLAKQSCAIAYADAENTLARSRLFASVEDDYMPSEAKAKWQEFHDNREVERLFGNTSNDNKFYDQARVVDHDGYISVVVATYQIGTGDWTLTPKYCFRQDGSLAEIRSEMFSSAFGAGESRDTVYSVDGQTIAATRGYFKMKDASPRPIEVPIESKPDGWFEAPIPLYRTVDDLPFHE